MIFKISPDFSTASALSQTNKFFHTLWTLHIPKICETVLPQAIECYSSANELFNTSERVAGPVEDWQEELLADLTSAAEYDAPEVTYFTQAPEETKETIEKVHYMIVNKMTVERFLKRYSTEVFRHVDMTERELTLDERLRFIKVYYHVMTLATLVHSLSTVEERLPKLSRLELLEAYEVASHINLRKTALPSLRISSNTPRRLHPYPQGAPVSAWPTSPEQHTSLSWRFMNTKMERRCLSDRSPKVRDFARRMLWIEGRPQKSVILDGEFRKMVETSVRRSARR